MIFLCLFYHFQLFSCEGKNILVAKQQSVMVFLKVCGKPLVRLFCAVLDCLSKRVSCILEQPERMLSEECRLLFEQTSLLKTRTHFFMFCSTTDATLVIIFKPYHSYKLQFNLLAKRFYIRVSLLDYMFATANEHTVVFPDLMNYFLSGLYRLTFLA